MRGGTICVSAVSWLHGFVACLRLLDEKSTHVLGTKRIIMGALRSRWPTMEKNDGPEGGGDE